MHLSDKAASSEATIRIFLFFTHLCQHFLLLERPHYRFTKKRTKDLSDLNV